MRTLEELRSGWKYLYDNFTDVNGIKEAAKSPRNGKLSTRSLRSVVWKSILLFGQETPQLCWTWVLTDSRNAYTGLREHFLRYIDHPEDLDAVDPLADDAESPWSRFRSDQELRSEIQQDVERCMQDQELFRQPVTQKMMLDILFIFCKIESEVGYRQGMHDLLAPVLWVISQDALDVNTVGDAKIDDSQTDALNPDFIEHDSFTIFSVVMEIAKTSYAQTAVPLRQPNHGESALEGSISAPPIVQRSQYIHNDLLQRVDPELALHLISIDVLPQVFLIRWIRLLFSREFDLESLLDLWDVLFAEGLTPELVDYVCVAMLLRIRWELLDADYSTALTLLLHYPTNEETSTPESFVQDAVYLLNHSTAQGGSHVITQRTNRDPVPFGPVPQRDVQRTQFLSSTPRRPNPTSSQRIKTASPSKGFENLLQGAAKEVLHRGEQWGLNKAVREAMGEVRRNVQQLQAQNPNFKWNGPYARWSLDEGKFLAAKPEENLEKLKAIVHRNERLAEDLDDAAAELRRALTEQPLNDLPGMVELMLSKVDVIKILLQDSTIELHTPTKVPGAAEVPDTPTKQPKTDSREPSKKPQPPPPEPRATTPPPTKTTETQQNIPPHTSPSSMMREFEATAQKTAAEESESTAATLSGRPRSSLAQSSFAWMLGDEDEERPTTGFMATPSSAAATGSDRRQQSRSGNSKNAFLFGDETEEMEFMNMRKGKDEEGKSGSLF